MAWKDARKHSGADAMDFLLCADDRNGDKWLGRRMTTAEGSCWVKDVLAMLGMDAKSAAGYSTHSLKAACLSCASKEGWIAFSPSYYALATMSRKGAKWQSLTPGMHWLWLDQA